MSPKNSVYPIVLSGGSGTRLWPLSRSTMPKQFVKLLDEVTLFENTISRLNGDFFYTPIIVSGDISRFMVKRELENKRPIIGVCLGAQLLASAAGGDVEILKYGSPPKVLPEIGWSKIFINKSSNEFKELFEEPFHVLHWHGDRILLPNKAILIASSERCKEQFFRIGDFAYGLQFHIEATEAILEEWIKEDKEFIYRGLGLNGQKILREENRKFIDKTFSKRMLLITKLFNLLSDIKGSLEKR